MEVAAEPSLMITILLLEVLGLQEHALAPKNRAKLIHDVPPPAHAQHMPRPQADMWLGNCLVDPKIDDFDTPIFVSAFRSVVRRDRFTLAIAPDNETI
jgi:hypothetical protein